jgi:hypothetical protein
MNYEQKYLKYKTKYLNLKSLIGGGVKGAQVESKIKIQENTILEDHNKFLTLLTIDEKKSYVDFFKQLSHDKKLELERYCRNSTCNKDQRIDLINLMVNEPYIINFMEKPELNKLDYNLKKKLYEINKINRLTNIQISKLINNFDKVCGDTKCTPEQKIELISSIVTEPAKINFMAKEEFEILIYDYKIILYDIKKSNKLTDEEIINFVKFILENNFDLLKTDIDTSIQNFKAEIQANILLMAKPEVKAFMAKEELNELNNDYKLKLYKLNEKFKLDKEFTFTFTDYDITIFVLYIKQKIPRLFILEQTINSYIEEKKNKIKANNVLMTNPEAIAFMAKIELNKLNNDYKLIIYKGNLIANFTDIEIANIVKIMVGGQDIDINSLEDYFLDTYIPDLIASRAANKLLMANPEVIKFINKKELKELNDDYKLIIYKGNLKANFTDKEITDLVQIIIDEQPEFKTLEDNLLETFIPLLIASRAAAAAAAADASRAAADAAAAAANELKILRTANFESLKISKKCGMTSGKCKEVIDKFNECIDKEKKLIDSYILPASSVNLSTITTLLAELKTLMTAVKITDEEITKLILAKVSTPLVYQTNLNLYTTIKAQITTKYK